ncbi:MAG: hypothetical protein GX793_07495 [Bacteroidales bacterium]|jgi:hypothetical protein|nr:outer membrane protein transport protein [Bacteroidales bacterium]MCK9499611.1 outer membrane protein transport protein [Bacteroidales bacterium]MDY0313742.1 outer membrane protein transport protein [Bacteroidales bacterium]NLB86887.1 hypothetical protein [Bacteroidales bacterium]
MKKSLIFAIISLTFCTGLLAQNEVDALRYSYLIPGGTARYNAMGGSFGALGADPSVISFNPAGLGIYKSSEFSFSTGFALTQNYATINNNQASDFDFNFNINNISYINSINIKENSGLKSLNFGFAYNRLNNFNENIIIKNPVSVNSLTDWLAASGDRILWSDLGNKDQFYSKLAWETYLIDQNLPDTFSYVSAFAGKYGIEQTQSIYHSGNQGSYDFSLAANIEDKFFIGGSLGIASVKFTEMKRLEEVDINDSIIGFNALYFTEKLDTRGNGLNFKFGFLYSPIPWMRIGAGVHTPTFYKLRDEYSTKAESNFTDANKSLSESSPLGRFDYQLSTPFRANASLGLILAGQFLLNIDYDYLDYSKARLRSFDYGFYGENENIMKTYSQAHNLRLGLEYRMGGIAFRTGLAYFDSPFKSGHINQDSYYMTYNGGVGFRTNSLYFDIAYSFINNKINYYMYEGLGVDSPETLLKMHRHRLVLSLGFKF